MTLNSEGCTDCESLKKWYHYIFDNVIIQDVLIPINDRSSFIDEMITLSSENGFDFTRDALGETFSEIPSGWSEAELIDMGVDDKWARKLMVMGWAPIGYSR